MRISKYLNFFIALLLGTSAVLAEQNPASDAKGRWGYVNEYGTVVIKQEYDAALPFQNGYAKVCKKGKWGIIDQSGKYLLKPEYTEIQDFFNGIAVIKKDDKYGYIREDFTFLIPCKYSSIGSFNSQGLVWVQDGKKYGILKRDGSVFLEPKWAAIGIFALKETTEYKYPHIKNQTKVFETHVKLDGPFHYIVKKDIDCDFLSQLPENPKGYWFAKNKEGWSAGIMDPNGNVVLNACKFYTSFYPTNGLILISQGSNYNFYNPTTGKKLLKKDVDDAMSFHDGIAIVRIKYKKNVYKFKFINPQGNDVTGIEYDQIFPQVNGVYITYNNGKYGMCDIDGKEILQPEFASIAGTKGDLWAASKDGNKYGYINNNGDFQIPAIYDYTHHIEQGNSCFVKRNNKWGVINPWGEEIVPIKWDDLLETTEEDPEFVWVGTTDGENKTFKPFNTKTHKVQFESNYSGAWNFGVHFPGVAIVNNGADKFGCVDTYGNEIIPLELTNTAVVVAAYRELMSRTEKIWRPIDSHRFRLRMAAPNETYKLSTVLDNTQWEY